MKLFNEQELIFVQKKEFAELFGFETRNKFDIYDNKKNLLAHAAEENRGLWGLLARQLLGHWRSFKIHIYDESGREILIAHHPFRFLFARLEVRSPDGQYHGALQRRFSLFHKKFTLENESARPLLEVKSPLWRPWTFRFLTPTQREVAIVRKKWGGVLKEFFLDADSFQLILKNPAERESSLNKILVASALFIDLQFFETKARS